MTSTGIESLKDMAGLLYVVATPIGNLEDVTRRGAEVLKSVALIAAEDTRRTRVLLEAIGADQPQILALHAHNESAAMTRVLARLEAGEDAALVSDAGTPLLSDPGYELVRACWQAGIGVIPVPGPSAILAVLSVCPLPIARFRFEGFLPARAPARRARLQALADYEEATVFFEAPHRIAESLRDLAAVVPGRDVMIGREMTKRHEQYLCGPPAELLERLAHAEQLRGEFVIVMSGAVGTGIAPDARRTMAILARELPPAQAARIGAELLGVGKRELYALALELRTPEGAPDPD